MTKSIYQFNFDRGLYVSHECMQDNDDLMPSSQGLVL